jgi:hypothetical protein
LTKRNDIKRERKRERERVVRETKLTFRPSAIKTQIEYAFKAYSKAAAKIDFRCAPNFKSSFDDYDKIDLVASE